MYKINLNKDKILIVAKEIKKNFPKLNLKISIINKKIIIKSDIKLNKEIKKKIETIIKIHFPDNILILQENNYYSTTN